MDDSEPEDRPNYEEQWTVTKVNPLKYMFSSFQKPANAYIGKNSVQLPLLLLITSVFYTLFHPLSKFAFVFLYSYANYWIVDTEKRYSYTFDAFSEYFGGGIFEEEIEVQEPTKDLVSSRL